MIEERVNHEDLMLYHIMSNPVFAGEFINNFDYDPRFNQEEFEYTIYQKEVLLDFSNYIVFRGARSIGKTIALRDLFIWAMVYNLFPGEYYVFTVPGRAHLEPVFTAVSRAFRMNSFLKHFIAKNQGINNSDYTIELLNKAKILCRIAGQSGNGRSVNSLHTPFEILDEGGFYSWGTFIEFIPTLNTWTPGHKRVVAGVPTGLREKNVMWFCDQQATEYSKHRVSALQNPRFSDEDHQRAIEQYGGTESEEYTKFVLGLHGKPMYSLFDRGTMEIGTYPVYKLELNGLKTFDNIAEYIEKLSVLPSLPNKNFKCFFGIDLGYTEPTAIFVLYTDDYGRIKFHAKIEMTKVSYPIQEKLLDYLDTKYSPLFWGMDEGNTGKSVRQHLTEDLQYNHKNYIKRIIPIDFSSTVSLGTGPSGEDLTSKTKPFSTQILQDYSNNHKIVYSSTDLETIVELERMTYTTTRTGDIVYHTLTEQGGKKGADHFTSAILCGCLAYYQMYEIIKTNLKKKLAKPTWVGVH